MKNVIKPLIVFFTTVVIFIACKKNEVPPANLAKKPPQAYAGMNRIFLMPTNDIVLDGIGKDADGYIVNFQWTRAAGPTGLVISHPNSAKTMVSLTEFGEYVLELKVTDNDGLTGVGFVRLTVDSTANLNDPCLGCWD